VKRLFALVVLAGAGIAALFAIPSDHYLFLPDPARPVDPLVEVPDEEQQAGEDDEGVYMVDILIRKASLAERVFPGLAEGSSLVPGHVVNPVGVSEGERREASLNDMSRSQEVAVTVALRSLGHEVEVVNRGVEIDTVVPGSPAAGKLEVGDVIVEARGRPVRTREDLLETMEPVRPGSDVEVTVLRDGKRVPVSVGTEAAEDDPDRAVFGVIVVQASDFRFPVDVEIDAGDIGGPSAGLAFALDVVDELGEDIDGGRKIAVTGELDLEGEVGPIGGIKQKTIGARQAGADIFLVPDENAAEARKHAEDLEIVAVSTFDEALSALRTD
jgi:PDZ domain-containing protein